MSGKAAAAESMAATDAAGGGEDDGEWEDVTDSEDEGGMQQGHFSFEEFFTSAPLLNADGSSTPVRSIDGTAVVALLFSAGAPEFTQKLKATYTFLKNAGLCTCTPVRPACLLDDTVRPLLHHSVQPDNALAR